MHRLRIALAALVACAEILGASGTARAHAFLEHAEPRVGSTVRSAPAAVTLSFTEPVEAKSSRVTVFGRQGEPVDAGPLEQPAPAQLRLALPPLPNGSYTVRWAATAVDTHQSDGAFEFTVAP